MPDLIKISYPLLLFIEMSFLAALALNLNGLREELREVSRGQFLTLALIVAAGALLRFFWVPYAHYVFYDEYEHIAVARNMLESGLFSRCDFYLDGKCLSSWQPQWLPGYHFLLSQFFSLSGVSERAAFIFNSLFSSLSLPAVFLLTYFCFRDAAAALIAAALTAFLPLHLKFAGGASTETLSLFFLLVTAASWFFYARRRTGRALFLALAAAAFALLARAENGLLLALFPLFLVLFAGRGERLKPLLFLPAAALPYLLYLPGIRAFMLGGWLAAHESAPAAQFLWPSLKYWISGISVPVLVTAAAALSFFTLFRKNRRELAFFGAWFLLFIAAYACVEKLDISFEDSQRFNLALITPAVVLAAAALSGLFRAWRPALSLESAARALLLAALLANYIGGLDFVKSAITQPGFYGDRAALLAESRGAADPVYVSYAPSFPIAVLGAPSVNISFLSDKEAFDKFLKGRNLVLVDDHWCRKDPRGLCAAAKERFHVPGPAPGAPATLLHAMK